MPITPPAEELTKELAAAAAKQRAAEDARIKSIATVSAVQQFEVRVTVLEVKVEELEKPKPPTPLTP
jgi:pyruvoyl-dependent arginine decarboxylase (PvlArgDC)